MFRDFQAGNFYSSTRGILLCNGVEENHINFTATDGAIINVYEDQISHYNLKPVCLIVSENGIPEYKTPNSAGVDLMSNENITLPHLVPTLVHTGIKVAIPVGYEGQVRPRSGLALKEGITVLNSPGTIDADYRGEVGVILINFGLDYHVVKGDRIAQLVFSKVEQLEFVKATFLPETERGEGGFGHTGK